MAEAMARWPRTGWKRQGGPAMGVVGTLHRLGWQALAPATWRTDLGQILDVTHWSPAYVAKLVDQATERGVIVQLQVFPT